MDCWAQLGRTAEARLSAFQRERERRAIQERYRSWAKTAPWSAIVALHAELKPWVDSLGRSASRGCSSPGAPLGLALREPYRIVHGDLERSVTSLELGDNRVDVHAQWTLGTPPSVHLLRSRVTNGRCGGLATAQGAWLGPGDGFAETMPRLYSYVGDVLMSVTDLAQQVAHFACSSSV